MIGRGAPSGLAKAAALHQAGRLDEAERGYRRILREQKKDADAHYFLGVLRLQKGDAAQGTALLRRALVLAPSMPHGIEGLAGAEETAQRLDAALTLTARAQAVHPVAAAARQALTARRARLLFAQARYAEAERLFAAVPGDGPEARAAALDRGLCLRRLARTGEAEAVYAALLRSSPADPDALLGLGEARAEGGRRRDAMAPLRRLVALGPAHLPARLRLAGLRQELDDAAGALHGAESVGAVLPPGIEADALRIACLSLAAAALRGLGRAAEAQARLHRLLSIEPGLADGWSNLGNLAAKTDCAVGEGFAARALAIEPAHVGALINRALALSDLERGAAAIRHLRRALALVPADTSILSNFHGALCGLQAWAELDRLLLRALAIDPGFAMARYMLGTAALTRGDQRRGWALYRARLDSPYIQARRPFPQPRWDGRGIAGRLLVWGEQGVGDEVLHAGLLGGLAARGIQAVVECDRRLVAMFERSFPGVGVVARRDPPDERLLARDIVAQVAFGDLAFHLDGVVEVARARAGCLVADRERARASKAWLDGLGPGFKVGIAWRGGHNDALSRRVHTGIGDWAPILKTAGCVFVNLQYGDCAAELEQIERRLGIRVHAMPGLDLRNDLDGALALSSVLDAGVATPSASGMIFGATGRPLVLLLEETHYFALGTGRYPWFPQSEGVVRRYGADWSSALAETGRRLAALACRETRTGG